MQFILKKSYRFEAAHFLPFVDKDHKCKRTHGHSYKFTIEISSGELIDGMVVDYKDISQCVKGPILQVLDHQLLNEFMVNPTAENICLYIANIFKHDFCMNFYRPGTDWYKGRERKIYLGAVEVCETDKTMCRVEFNELL